MEIIEKEDDNTLYGDKNPPILKPYNPLDVDIVTQTLVLSNIIARLENNEIDLSPNFQRNPNLWKDKEQSRLIESLLIRIPLPVFYFDTSDETQWVVIDGLQRLSVFKRFFVLPANHPQKLRLSDLEYLTDLNDKTFEELPKLYQRRLLEQNMFAYMIRSGTPDDVKTSIFKRINTGGIHLNNTEIRNAVYKGQAATLVKNMADAAEFKTATRGKVSSTRFEDRDLIIRFVAFAVQKVEDYEGNIDDFLDNGMAVLKKYDKNQVVALYDYFIDSMNYCYKIFGDYSFRKFFEDKNGNKKFGPINKSLFDTVSTEIPVLKKDQLDLLVENKENFMENYKNLFFTDFFDCIDSATGSIEHVKGRHTKFHNFLINYLENL